jgi:glycerol-3-phosphate dehydrogenase
MMKEKIIVMEQYDVLVIGGGVNGCGIARDAVGRGLKVALVEQGDLAAETSSSSTKLFHGGLRYLELYEFGLVKKALIEREVLLRNMPHISWPMRFVIPHLKGMRPKLMLRAGLFIYDYIGGRKLLPPTKTVHLNKDPLGDPLVDAIKIGFEYSDCWVDDARLVVLNARDAAARGAQIMVRTKFTTAKPKDGQWVASLKDMNTGKTKRVQARILINAGGPWVKTIIEDQLKSTTPEKIRLVRGSHIIVPKIYAHDRAYFFQIDDGRLVFTIPYENDFTLIGTTDVDHEGDPMNPQCSPEEAAYLCDVVSNNFKKPITTDDIVWTYAGVRPLNDGDEGDAKSASRDYEIKVREIDGSPLINIFGGKITTFRKLSEEVVAELAPFTQMIGKPWTHHAHLPGGDFALQQKDELIAQFRWDFPFLGEDQVRRMFKAYGTQATEMLKGMTSAKQMGKHFGAGLTEVEVYWLMNHEWAQTAQDVVWRRTKLGLRLTKRQITALDVWMKQAMP